MTQFELDVARSFKSLLQDRLGSRLLELRIFGSRARGDGHEESDLDLLVLVDRNDRETRYLVSGLAADVMLEQRLPFTLSTLVRSQEQFDELVTRERLIALDILADGILL